MGVGISQELERKAFQLVEIATNESGVKRSQALKELWNLSHNDQYKIALCHSKLRLLELLHNILLHEQQDRLSVRYSVFCLWYLSRELKNRHIIASASNRLIPALMSLIRDDEWREPILKIVSNCVLTSRTHSYLLSEEVGLFSFCHSEMRETLTPALSCYHRFFANIATVVQSQHIHYFVRSNIPQFMFNLLLGFGPRPARWQNRVNGLPYWCLNFLMAFSSVREGAKHLRSIAEVGLFFAKMMSCEDMEGFKAAVILTNILYRNNDENDYYNRIIHHTEPILVKFEHLKAMTLEIFQLQLKYDPSVSESRNLAVRGYAYGIIQLRDIVAFLRNLAIHPINRQVLFEMLPSLLPSALTSLQLFLDNASECTARYDIAVIYGGGGGRDWESIEHLLELLLILSLDYDVNNDDEEEGKVAAQRLQEQFQVYKSNITIVLMALIQLNDVDCGKEGRKLSVGAKAMAQELLRRLQRHSTLESTKFIHAYYYLTEFHALYPTALTGLLHDLSVTSAIDLSHVSKEHLLLLSSLLQESSRKMFREILQLQENHCP
mmetsp:Transcript_23156/g.25388  ORF Transcript_23156/g.25388 Transcript_23156/m.25388 type:complete len:550 (+) Transcript_23156:51-1700(+)